MIEKERIKKYIKEYRWSNVFEMIKNSRLEPEECFEDFNGKNVVITGATSGIGYFTAKKYASKGANIIAINRNIEKSEKLKEELSKEYNINFKYFIADLSSLEQIKNAANYLNSLKEPVDLLIHNAGIYLTKKEITEDGFEKVFVVNYLSYFIINYMIMEKLKSQTNNCRIIIVSSEGYRFAVWGLDFDDINWEKRRYNGLKSYGASKVAQLLSMIIFNEKFNGTNVTINAMHPGAVRTEAGRDNDKLYLWFKKNIYDRILQSPEISARALYYLGVSPKLNKVSCKFFNLTKEENLAPQALDKQMAEKLWNLTLKILKI